jgi:hypothetical protein
MAQTAVALLCVGSLLVWDDVAVIRCVAHQHKAAPAKGDVGEPQHQRASATARVKPHQHQLGSTNRGRQQHKH